MNAKTRRLKPGADPHTGVSFKVSNVVNTSWRNALEAFRNGSTAVVTDSDMGIPGFYLERAS